MNKGLNVLSLFDGISCGQVALERAGIKVDKYYASEIDKYAIQVTQKNYPNTIQLGDITKWKEWDLDWSSIDLVMGGSPCQGFSNAGKGLNFEDPRSKLFFVFVDILNYIKELNPNVKFLLENVKMKKEWQDIITGYMGVEPILINSALVSAQNRTRLYWTNIGTMEQPKDKNILLDDILDIDSFSVMATDYLEFKNFYTIPRKKDNKLINGSYNRIWKNHNNYCGAVSASNIIKIGYKLFNCIYARNINVLEAERLQTLPDCYTDGISNSQRYKAIGNGWTVDVIVHILQGLKSQAD